METLSPTIQEAILCLQRLSHAFEERRSQLARSVGLTEPQWEALEQVSAEHFMPSLFARQRESSLPAVSKLLRTLLERGLVTAHVGSPDARHRRYLLTEAGREAISNLRRERARAIRAVWRDWPENELQHFTRFGNLLCERLERYIGTVATKGH